MKPLSIVLIAVLFISLVNCAARGRHAKGKAGKTTAVKDDGTADDLTPLPIHSEDGDGDSDVDEVEFPEHNIIGKLEHGSPIKSRSSRSHKH